MCRRGASFGKSAQQGASLSQPTTGDGSSTCQLRSRRSWPTGAIISVSDGAEPFLGGSVIPHPRGRVLCGSPSVNGMVFTRGNPGDFDKWEAQYGCTGWGYRNVLPYFKKFETSAFGETEYRGGSGPLRISVPPMANPILKAWLEAGRQAGFPVLRDSNSASQEGFAPHEQTIADGYRCSTAYAYLTSEVRKRPNLEIRTDSPVEKLLFNGNRAVAVDYVRNGQREKVSASCEIILCGGSVNSPQLLMQSGVGDAEALRAFDIPVHHLPGVGANPQDHPTWPSTPPARLLRSRLAARCGFPRR